MVSEMQTTDMHWFEFMKKKGFRVVKGKRSTNVGILEIYLSVSIFLFWLD